MGTKWQMPIAVIGKPTGDGRQFDAGALSHRDLPLPFRYVASDSGGHKDAVIVGHISKIGKEKGGFLPAQGEYYDDDSWPENVREAATAARMFTANKVIGPSVDLDQAEQERVPEPKAYNAWKKEQAGKLKAAKMAHGGDCGCGSTPSMPGYDGPHLNMVRKGRIASATLVHIPAFAELSGLAKLTPIDSHDPNVDGTTSSAMVAGAMVEFVWDEVEWLDPGKIENDDEFAKMGRIQGQSMSDPDADGDEPVPNRTTSGGKPKRKRDPETVKGNQDTQEMAVDDEGSGIWLSDDEYEEFARRRLPRPGKQKSVAGNAETPGGDAEQGQGGGGMGGNTYAAPDVTKASVRKQLPAEDFVDSEGRRFPIATCGDVPDAVSSYGRADPKIPYAKFKARLTAIAKRKGCADSLPDDWKAGEKMAALMAAAAPAAPPAVWFANPALTGPTPLTIDDDGRVFGHVAVWDTCHVGIGDSCVKPPKSRTGYAYFHTGETVTQEGERVAVGRLTYGAGHAQPNLGYRAAAEHYDNSTNTGAVVRAGEDEHGIWVAGALVPEADEAAVRVMRSTPLSGDWRRIGTNLEMVAALHVNTAGFPIPRAVLAAGEPFALVAAGALAPDGDRVAPQGAGSTVDAEALGRAIVQAMEEEKRRLRQREHRWDAVVAAAEEAFVGDRLDQYAGAMRELASALAE